jgi:hypothetical protein
MTNNLNATLHMWDKDATNLVDHLVLNIGTLSRNSEDLKEEWIKLNAVHTLSKAANTNELAKFSCYTALTNIADDAQIEQLEEIQVYADMQVDRLKLFQDGLIKNKLRRKKRQVFENNREYQAEILFIVLPGNIRASINITMNGLYRLAINQKMRDYVYFELNAKDYLHTFLEKGSVYEVMLTCRLLTQLSFNKNIALDINNNSHYSSLIKIIKQDDKTNSESKPDVDMHELKSETYDYCNRLVWNIKEARRVSDSAFDSELKKSKKEKNENKEIDTNQGHVMISYNTGSRELCLKVKQELEASGYRVWMDVQNIHGSSLDAMAKAVEDASAVLMCVTEKYRESINCQSEAQYAFRRGRPIIPCIMQTGYENVTGWLGIIMGDKIFINFMKYEFGECMRRLKGELDQFHNTELKPIVSITNSVSSPQSLPKAASQSKANSVLTWDSKKVKEWSASTNQHPGIMEYIKNIDGKILFQIYVSNQ